MTTTNVTQDVAGAYYKVTILAGEREVCSLITAIAQDSTNTLRGSAVKMIAEVYGIGLPDAEQVFQILAHGKTVDPKSPANIARRIEEKAPK